MAFLQNLEVNYNDTFVVKNLYFNFDNDLSTYDKSISAQSFGLGESVDFISGSIRQNSIDLSWQVERPITKNLLSGFIADDGFSGFLINYYDKNRNFLYQDPEVLYSTQYSKTSEQISEVFTLLTGQDNLSGLNQFFIDVVCVSNSGFYNSGFYNTGVSLVNFTNSSLSISSIFFDTDISINLNLSDPKSIKELDLFVTKDYDFTGANGDYLYTNKYFYPSFDNIFVPEKEINDRGANSLVDNYVKSPYYVHFLPSNYFSTGQLITSSGIKPPSYNESALPYKINGVTGYVYYDFNSTSKDLNLNAFIKWDSVSALEGCNFHILVEESGKNKTKYDYFLNNRTVENILNAVPGTGTGLFFTDTIFSNYGYSGIKWEDHTIYVNDFGSFPSGFFPQYTGGLKSISEIRIPSGSSDNNEVFLCYNYTGDNKFNFLPSGGHYQDSIYTGSYSDSRYLTNASLNNTGLTYLGDSNTGICMAKRITGFADFTYSPIDPSFIFPINEQNNYFVKVRAINTNEVVSEFSDLFYIPSGYINNTINLSPLSGKKVIDGSGVSGYLPVFSDSDSLTTGTLYYSGSNNLVFTELPTTTTTEELYKLVIEDNIIKKQLDAGNGTALIDTFTENNHGFAVGNVVRFDGSNWYKAQADSAEHAEVQGVVRNIVNANTFKLVYDGLIEGLSGLTPGTVYFLSPTTAGAVTITEPSNFGEVSKPVYFALTTTSANVLTFRGVIIEPQSGTSGTSGTSGDPVISSTLAYYNNSTQSVSSSSNTKVIWSTADTTNTQGSIGLTFNGTDRFTNTSGNSIVITVDGYVGWASGGTSGTSRSVFIVKNGNVSSSQGRYSYSSIPANNDYPVTHFSSVLVLNNNDYVEVYVLHNDASLQNINSQVNYPASRIIIARNEGVAGTSGINGTSGSSGITGTSGSSGISGTSGSSGISGTSGSSGISGTSGSSGTSGINGTSGSSGISGTSGSSGISGTSGSSGISGTSGSSGISGTSGTSGSSGKSGTSGTSGSSSDIRFKKNITPLTYALEKILKLQGVQYEWNEFINAIDKETYKLNILMPGLIAQDVEKIIPEIVETSILNEEIKDARTLYYSRIIPYLIEAAKQQQKQIDQLKSDVEILMNE